MRVQTRQPTKIPSQLHPLAEVIARRDFRWNSETAYAELAPYAFAGDLTIEFYLMMPPQGNRPIIGDDHTSSYYINIAASGLSFWGGGSGVNVSGPVVNYDDNKFHHYRLVLVGTTLHFYFDGEWHGTVEVTTYTGLNYFLVYRANSNANCLTGTMYGLRLWDNSNGSELVVDMPLTKYLPNPNVIENKAKPLGADLVVNGSFDNDLSGWRNSSQITPTWESGRVRLKSSTTLWQSFKQQLAVTNGTYLISMDVERVDGRVDFSVFDSNGTANRIRQIQPNGHEEFIVVITSGYLNLYFENILEDGEIIIDNVSVRSAEGWGQYIEPMPEDWGIGPFELQWNGDWEGQELSSISEVNIATPDLDSAGYYWWNTAQVISSRRYKVACYLEENNSANAGWSTDGGIPYQPPFHRNDVKDGAAGGEFIANNSRSTTVFYRHSPEGSVGSIRNISVKEVLKSA